MDVLNLADRIDAITALARAATRLSGTSRQEILESVLADLDTATQEARRSPRRGATT